MRGLFNYDGPVMSFLGKVADLMLLNIITLICCIPVVTAGAAFTGLYYMTIKMIKKEEGYIMKGYFKSFRENFKQATVIWLIALGVLAILAADHYIVTYVAVSLPKVFAVFVWAAFILFAFTLLYVFPVLSRFENTVPNTIKNAFLMSVLNFPRTFIMLALFVVPALVGYMFPMIFPIAFLLGVSLPAYISSWFFVRVFKKFEPEEPEEKLGDF